MNTRFVEEFLVFAESLNYSAAAKKLFITRGTLHEHITQLENELGVELIEKGPNGILCLTSMGEQFLLDGRTLLDSVSNVVNKYYSWRENTLTLRIGSVDFIWLEPYIYAARERYLLENPGKSVEFVSIDRDTVEQAFAENLVDIAVASRKHWLDDAGSMNGVVFPHTQTLYISQEETHLLVPSTHRLHAYEEIHASDLEGDTIVLPKNICDWWKRDGVIGAVAAAGGSVNLVGKNFKNLPTYFAYDFGNNLGGVSRSQIARSGVDLRSDFRVMRMEDLPLISRFYAVCKDEVFEDENARRFLDCFETVVAEGMAGGGGVHLP